MNSQHSNQNRARFLFGISILVAVASYPHWVGAETADDDEWDIWVAPYLWAISMTGDASIGNQEADVDVGFSDILKDLDFGLMGYFDARKEKLGFFFNPLMARLKSDSSTHGLDIDVTTDQAVISAGAYYRVLETRFGGGNGIPARRFILEPLIGVRWTYLRNEIDVNQRQQIDKSESWMDPVVGARMLADLTQRWDLLLAADVGGPGGGSDFTWNTTALLGYRFKMGARDAAFRFGYRALYLDYDTGSGRRSFEWDVTQHGPIAGLAIRF